MMMRHILWAAVAATALTACGGDSSDSPAPSPTPTPTPSPSPSPLPVSGDRIEPLDTALSPSSAQAKSAQAATRHIPAGAPVGRVQLGPLAVVKSAVAPEAKGVAYRIGEGRDVLATAEADGLAALLSWSPTADGGLVAGISFVADGAQAVRLGVLADSIPAGTVLRFYGAETDEVVEMSAAQLAALRLGNEQGGVTGDAARMVWGPDTTGDVSTLEVQLAPGVDPAVLRLAVPRLSHLGATAEQTLTSKTVESIGSSASCHQDVMCRPDLETESRAVAKMLYTSSADGRSYMCTGTLLNDAKGSRTPNFVTATHCVPDQATASSLITYWFFRAAACNSTPQYDQSMTRVTGALSCSLPTRRSTPRCCACIAHRLPGWSTPVPTSVRACSRAWTWWASMTPWAICKSTAWEK
ncbi:hypothetical protein [Ottowia sp. VDI28]|uniref:hypothetical protein n=1 Tax=Ottowia sp. VDI28 TaxID=3133968 RepID=UPI003C2FB612